MLAELLAAEAAPSARKETENQSYRIETLLAVERVSGNGLSFFKPDSWCFLLMEDMQEMVGLGPSLGGATSQGKSSLYKEEAPLFVCMF